MPVNCWHYHLTLIREGVLLVCVSQSGESYEVVKLLEEIPSGIICIGITNEENSTLARKSDITLLCKAGREEMTSTKTYVSTLLVLSIFSSVLAGRWKLGSMPELNAAITAVGTLIKNYDKWLAPAMDFLGHPPFVQVIGRGPSYSSVLQAALMIMEAARNPGSGHIWRGIHTWPFGNVKERIQGNSFCASWVTYEQGIKLSEDIARYGGRVVLITNSTDRFNNPDIHPIRIPCQDEYQFSIPAIVFLQFIVNQWATDEGNEPGNFTMGAKVTTTE